MSIVGVYQIPALNELAWRTLLAGEAIARGWTYLEDPVNLAEIKLGQSVLIVTSDPEMAGLAGVEAWTVLAADPARAADLLVERLGMGNDSLWHIARRGAAADTLLRGGGGLVDASDAEIEIAGFGRIAAPKSSEACTRARGGGPLAIYSHLPVAVGATADWPPEVYKLPTNVLPGVEPIDLTGRDRLLIQGPYFDITPGTWTLTVDLEIVAPKSGIPLSFEWGHDADVTQLFETIRQPGLYRIKIEHEWTKPGHADFRILLTQPIFQGGLNLLASRVERTA